MSVQLIQQYYSKVEKLIQYSGSKNEIADSAKPPIKPKPIIKADKQANSIRIDTTTTLKNTRRDIVKRDGGEWIRDLSPLSHSPKNNF